MALTLQEIVKEQKNVAPLLDDAYLDKLGASIKQQYKDDDNSRSEWMETYEYAMKAAMQVYEKKNTPWDNASNVKYPLITVGALQFHARAYPALLPPKGFVGISSIGMDPTGQKYLLGKVIGTHMSYQFQYEMKGWEEGMDKLLITLPITGCEFKKTYFDPQKGFNCSEHVPASDLVINYWAKSLEDASRKTHVIPMTRNDIVSMQRAGLFREVELGNPIKNQTLAETIKDETTGTKRPGTVDESTPYTLLEWHGYIDLDEDGYAEPYVVTIEESSSRVLRIVARYYAEGIIQNEQGAVIRITPVEYFTKFDFIPNPSGGFYGIGFGRLLGSLNEAVDTMVNQLVDAGSLSNLQSGYISRNLRIRNGKHTFKPGEWKEVNATGQDLRQSILPLPVREPSMVLFQLLSMLIGAGERISSTTDMMVGENPGQNQKATTTMAVLDQGMKIFTAIYKRIRLALGKEFEKVFALNHYFLDEEKTKILFDGNAVIKKEFYDLNNMVVYPTADPANTSSAEKLGQAQALLQVMTLGGFNDFEIKRRYLEAIGIDDPERVLLDPQQSPPPPDPKLLKVQGDLQEDAFRRKLDTLEFMTETQQDAQDMEIKKLNAETARLKVMLDSFNQGVMGATKNREVIMKELQHRREVNAKSRSE